LCPASTVFFPLPPLREADVRKLWAGDSSGVWELRVKDSPAAVTMDAHGRSLHQEVADKSKGRLQGVLAGAWRRGRCRRTGRGESANGARAWRTRARA
jgi:hypothetical protein